MSSAAKHDLTMTIMNYLDRHQVLPLLEFLQEKEIYNSKDLQKAKLALVSKTKMVDFAIEEYKKLNETEDIPAEMEEQRGQVYTELEQTQEACGPLLKILHRDDNDNEPRPSADYLRDQCGVTDANIDALYPYAKLNFGCGRYQLAADTLDYFRKLSDDEEKKFLALWGKLAAEILMVNCEDALEDLKELRQEIDKRIFADHAEQLQQRTWIIHWSLFIFFNMEDGLNAMLEFFFQEKMLNTIQTSCPHILRYIVTAVVINKSRKNVLKDAVKLLSAEEGIYHDPITDFLVSIYSNFDFDASHTLLNECAEVVANDFFLGQDETHIAKFMEGARLLVFETYCHIHQCIDIDAIAAKLNLSDKPAESDIMELIRTANVNATIDAEKKQIVMRPAQQSVFQAVMNRNKQKNMDHRSRQVLQQVEKREDANYV